jgi:hypothetical protein
MVMNTYFVVPGAGDNVTTFGTLHDALTTPGLQNGDVIQIEPGSIPGTIVGGDLPAVQHLTIQGDPNSDLQAVPYFYLDSKVLITPALQGFTLKHAQLDTLNGTLDFLTDGTITDCRIENNFNGISVALQGTSAAVIRDTYFENANPLNQGNSLVTVQPADGSNNLITDNQFVGLTGSDLVLLNYSGGANTTDVVAHNTFVGNTGLSPLMVVQNDNQGLTVQSNTFTDYDASGTALEVHPTVWNLQIVDNVITCPNGEFLSDGILVDAGKPTGPSSMVIANNHIHTAGSGSGIEFTAEQPGFMVYAKVEGNDLQGNGTGVLVDIGNGGSVAGIDLGGGAMGSWGCNDFRGDAGGFWSPNAAIAVQALAAAGPIQAQFNIFGVADPTTVIHDGNTDPTRATAVAANPLEGNAAYVETLWLDFLHRTGSLNPSDNDAATFVSLLYQGTPAAVVANAIARSPEALGIDVDGLYHQFLGRDADPAGRAGFVGMLQAGATLEGVSGAILTSPEYQSHYQNDGDFVQSLYPNLLRRTGSDAEIGGWLSKLPQVGRGGVAQAFLESQEFRDWEVADDYAQLLNRTPSPDEVNTWVGSGLDTLTIDAYFAASTEYVQNG